MDSEKNGAMIKGNSSDHGIDGVERESLGASEPEK